MILTIRLTTLLYVTIFQAKAAADHCNLIERRLTICWRLCLGNSRVYEVTGRLYKPGAVPGAEISVERTSKALGMDASPSAFPEIPFFGELGSGDFTNPFAYFE